MCCGIQKTACSSVLLEHGSGSRGGVGTQVGWRTQDGPGEIDREKW